jgi:hypothetical protein
VTGRRCTFRFSLRLGLGLRLRIGLLGLLRGNGREGLRWCAHPLRAGLLGQRLRHGAHG